MSKQYIDLVNGQVVFADPLKVVDTFSPTVRVSRSNMGVDVVRWGAKQLINTRLGVPGCDDNCLTKRFSRKYEFSSSTNLPETEAQATVLLKELDQFFADLKVLIVGNVIKGVKPSVATTFPIVE